MDNSSFAKRWLGSLNVVCMVNQAYGLILEGSYSEALLEMEPLQDHRELQVAVLAAMLYSHERSPSPDTDTIHTLRRRLETVDQNASERALVLAATLYWHLGGSTHIRNSYDLVTRSVRDYFASMTLKVQFLP